MVMGGVGEDEMKGKHVLLTTAQGGGGSFKNKKPKGEIGCC